MIWIILIYHSIKTSYPSHLLWTWPSSNASGVLFEHQVYKYTHTHMSAYIYVHAFSFMYVYVCICAHVHEYACICMCVHAYACVCKCVCWMPMCAYVGVFRTQRNLHVCASVCVCVCVRGRGGGVELWGEVWKGLERVKSANKWHRIITRQNDLSCIWNVYEK